MKKNRARHVIARLAFSIDAPGFSIFSVINFSKKFFVFRKAVIFATLLKEQGNKKAEKFPSSSVG